MLHSPLFKNSRRTINLQELAKQYGGSAKKQQLLLCLMQMLLCVSLSNLQLQEDCKMMYSTFCVTLQVVLDQGGCRSPPSKLCLASHTHTLSLRGKCIKHKHCSLRTTRGEQHAYILPRDLGLFGLLLFFLRLSIFFGISSLTAFWLCPLPTFITL